MRFLRKLWIAALICLLAAPLMAMDNMQPTAILIAPLEIPANSDVELQAEVDIPQMKKFDYGAITITLYQKSTKRKLDEKTIYKAPWTKERLFVAVFKVKRNLLQSGKKNSDLFFIARWRPDTGSGPMQALELESNHL